MSLLEMTLTQGGQIGACAPHVARGSIQENLQIWNILQLITVNVSAELSWTETCFHWHWKVRPSAIRSLLKLAPSQINCPTLHEPIKITDSCCWKLSLWSNVNVYY